MQTYDFNVYTVNLNICVCICMNVGTGDQERGLCTHILNFNTYTNVTQRWNGISYLRKCIFTYMWYSMHCIAYTHITHIYIYLHQHTVNIWNKLYKVRWSPLPITSCVPPAETIDLQDWDSSERQGFRQQVIRWGRGFRWMIGETDGGTLPTINRKMLTSSPDEWSIKSPKLPHPKWRDLNGNSHTNLIRSRISSGIPLFQGLDGRNDAKIHSSTSLVLHNGYSTTGHLAPFFAIPRPVVTV